MFPLACLQLAGPHSSPPFLVERLINLLESYHLSFFFFLDPLFSGMKQSVCWFVFVHFHCGKCVNVTSANNIQQSLGAVLVLGVTICHFAYKSVVLNMQFYVSYS